MTPKKLLLVTTLLLTSVLAHANGTLQLRVGLHRTEVFIQQSLINEFLLRLNVGSKIGYEYSGSLPELEVFTTARVYFDGKSSFGVEAQAFLEEDPLLPQQYDFHYELSTLIGVSW